MPKKHGAGKCGAADCCSNPCPCGVSGDPVVGNYGTLHVEIANVAMNGLSPPMCDPPRSGLTIDETWYNGVTFQFRHEWTISQLAANNPNGFDVTDVVSLPAYPVFSRCIQQTGYWQCFYTATDFFWWNIGCSIGRLGASFPYFLQVRVVLQCGLGSTASGSPILNSVTSQGSVVYYNDAGGFGSGRGSNDPVHPCHDPLGSYIFLGRDGAPFGSINTGPFDFRAFTLLNITWSP